MNLITNLLLLLIFARFFGHLFKIFGFQPIIGEMLGGVLISLTSLVTADNEGLKGIKELAVFLLIFAAGLEMNLSDIFSALRKKALICGLTSFFISFAFGLVVSQLLGLGTIPSSVVGLCFAITAMPVATGFLQNLKMIDTQIGHLIIGSVVVIDVVALLFLGIAFDMEKTSNILEFVKIFSIKTIKMAVFFVAIMIVNKFLRSEISRASKTEKAFNKLINHLGKEAVFGTGVLFVLGFSTLSEALGFHFIIGAFFGGLLLNKDIIGTTAFSSMNRTLGAITHHFLTPIFFAYIGLQFSVEALNNWVMLIILLVVGFSSKIFGSWLGSRFSGFSSSESLKAGFVLNSKGSLDLIVANLAYDNGYIDSATFSILIFIGVTSVLINPVLYRRFFPSIATVKANAPSPPV